MSYTALITPFCSDGSLDEEGLSELIHKQLQANIEGIVLLGSTGEAPTLSSEEKKTIIQIARRLIPSSVKLWVGTGSYSTATTIAATQQAESLGADAALVVTPYYNRPTQEGLFLHFHALSQATKLPLVIYNIAGRTGQNLSTDTLKRITDRCPTVIGVKESSGNLFQVQEVLELIPSLLLFSGDDAWTLPVMALGGHGVVSVIGNLFPEQVVALVKRIRAGRLKEAREIHYALAPLVRAAFLETNPIPIKSLMQIAGLPAGPCRLPLCAPTETTYQQLQHIYGKTQYAPC